MLKLLKNMRRKEVLMVLLCTVLVAVQVYFDLRLPDYMTELTMLIKTCQHVCIITSCFFISSYAIS